mmetsp:Transcript_35918/g.64920  ORF Transcript_35918/g.64920 Transcript_35918/m.64920 type:complete len:282 (-) Transcript_35918:259-1104(-)
MVLPDDSNSPAGIMDLVVKSRLALAAVLLEVIDPPEGLFDASGRYPLGFLDATSRSKRILELGVHHDDLPVCLTLIDEANSAQGTAASYLANSHNLRAQVDHVQRVVVARRVVDVVALLRVAVRLRKATVVERHWFSESLKLPRAFRVLPDDICCQSGLHLELLKGAKWHLIDVAEQSSILIQPVPDSEIYLVPHGLACVGRRRVPRNSMRLSVLQVQGVATHGDDLLAAGTAAKHPTALAGHLVLVAALLRGNCGPSPTKPQSRSCDQSNKAAPKGNRDR